LTEWCVCVCVCVCICMRIITNKTVHILPVAVMEKKNVHKKFVQ